MNRQIITLIRPQQWLKNLFVFMPLFFDRHATDWLYVWPCIVAFLAFCLAASGIYCFNDIHDAEADRLHPVKRSRPVASGAVSKRAAYTVMCIIWVAAFSLVAMCDSGLIGTLLFYIVMNVAYCIRLKQIALLDVFIIAIAVGTGTWGIAAVIPKYLSLRLPFVFLNRFIYITIQKDKR